MKTLFLASFTGGLLLGVYLMARGVEKRRRGAPDIPLAGPAEPKAILSLPMVAAFATIFGATGYLLSRFTDLGPAARVAIAAAVGLGGAFGALALVAAWAVPSARQEVVDERYLLQGHFARVTSAIAGAEPGAIVYEVNGTRYAAKALSVDGTPVDADTEVVIERVEDGVAYVEPWARVEERL
jgi:hypothetical protein